MEIGDNDEEIMDDTIDEIDETLDEALDETLDEEEDKIGYVYGLKIMSGWEESNEHMNYIVNQDLSTTEEE